MSVSSSAFRCKKLFSLVKKKLGTADEHLEGCKRIATTEIKPDIERLLKQKQWQISH
jgi:hypothetical protein